ncbi:MAG: ligase-associated DNA damage response endonuclease PdeM [Pseudomonadota bacterium]
MSGPHTIELAGEEMLLLPERAIFWPRRGTLIVADVHLGKEDVFGRHGMAIPRGATSDDLVRLAGLVERWPVNDVVVLGDLLHGLPSARSDWPGELALWLDAHAEIQFRVVAGNHDRPAAMHSLDKRIEWHRGDVLEVPFRLMHHPEQASAEFVLCGHLHPTLRIKTRADVLRSPVFWFADRVGVLPAFGRFTGGFNVQPAASDRLFMTGPDVVVDVSHVTMAAAADRPWTASPTG